MDYGLNFLTKIIKMANVASFDKSVEMSIPRCEVYLKVILLSHRGQTEPKGSNLVKSKNLKLLFLLKWFSQI